MANDKYLIAEFIGNYLKNNVTVSRVSNLLRKPLIIINSSILQKLESSDVKNFWIPAFAGMTFLEKVLSLHGWRA